MQASVPNQPPRTGRKPGRPATYIFDKPDDQLTEKERKNKIAIEKRRLRQNRSYHRRKKVRKNTQSNPNSSISPLSNPSTALSNDFTTNWRSIDSISQVPKLLPGFSQNPLDLLATATEHGNLSSSSLPDDTNHLIDTLDTTNQQNILPSEVDNSPIAPTISFSNIVDATVSSSADNPLVSQSVDPDASLEIDVTNSRLDMPSILFDIDKPKVEEDEHEATKNLVNSAMVAAKEYARSSTNLRDVMDRESDIQRMTGIKQIVFDNLRTKYMVMNPNVRNALRYLVVFPRSFNLSAAASIAGFDESQAVHMQEILDSMIQTNFLTNDKGRYEISGPARLFLSEDDTVLTDSFADNTHDVSRRRFVSHYRSQLKRLQDDNIHRVGWLREQAMALYDSERENMEYSEFLLNGQNVELREFLSAGITVMRYCVSAASRERVLQRALAEDETSIEDIFSSMADPTSTPTSSSDSSINITGCDKSHRARLQLALSEAYFDQLKVDDAEKALLRALKLMGDSSQKCGTASSSIIDRVLVLLLLSNLKLATNRIKDARLLCVKALRILAEANLGKSTFGINAMSNLFSIYLEEGNLKQAKSVASRLLDTLNIMRYAGMPIYADALGVCALVSVAESNFIQAEQQYARALETVGNWGSKQWTGIPVQHCIDLDLWLMEGLAEAIRAQGKISEAADLEKRAADDRVSRGLPRNSGVSGYLRAAGSSNDSIMLSSLESRPILRHLY